MIKLENLPEVTDRALDGLKADESLKSKILNAAIHEQKPSYPHKQFRYLAPVLLSSVAVMILCIFLLNGKEPVISEDQHLIHSFTAGNSETIPVSYTEIDSLSVKSIVRCSDGKKIDNDQLVKMLDILKNHSVIVTEDQISMNDQLNIFDEDGQCFIVPVNAPYMGWSDGIRKCDLFFELFENTDH